MSVNKGFLWFRIFLFIYVSLHHCKISLSQNNISGFPLIENFSQEEYKAGTQNWGIEIMDNGHLFFANNSGLLQYDGLNWHLYELPNKTIVRSVCVSKSKRVYVGGQDELGYFLPNEQGQLTYFSIIEKIPDSFLPLQDVWQMLVKDGLLYLRSVDRIYIFNEEDESFKIINPSNPITSIIEYEDEIYFAELYKGIVSVNNTSIVISGSEQIKSVPILNLIGDGDKSFIITEKNGIFQINGSNIKPLNSEVHQFLIKNEVFSSRVLDDSRIAIGTKFGGLIIFNWNGDILQILTNENGLINNNIQSLISDKQGNLWTGTSNGIDKIHLSSPVEIVHPDGQTDGTFYDIAQIDNKLYFGSNNALYVADLNQNLSPFEYTNYEIVPGSQGQVWGLDVVNNELFMGHNNGAFNIKNDNAELISQIPGAWKFIPTDFKDDIYVGTYYGIDIYKKVNDSWKFHKKLEGFVESSRIMISVQKNEIWVSHPYRGIYRILHDDNYFVQKVILYDESKGLPSTLQNYIFDIDGKPIVTAELGIYDYDRRMDRFVKNEEMNKVLDPKYNVRRLFENAKNQIWFITENEVGYLTKSANGSFLKTTYPALEENLVDGFQNLHFFHENEVLVCANNSVLKLNTSLKKETIPPLLQFSSVRLTGPQDSLLFGGFGLEEGSLTFKQTQSQIPELSYSQNEIVFNFNSPEHAQDTEYSYTLQKGNDKSLWSMWTNSTSKEYNNLTHAKYIFQIKARSNIRGESQICTYRFTIHPPWYLSKVAYAIYSIAILSMLGAIVLIPNKAYRKEKQLLTSANLQTEAKLEKIQNEKLQADIDFKNSELASSTLHLVQKNETINKIRQEVQNTFKRVKDPSTKKELKKIIYLLSDDERLEDEWEKFSSYFDQVHTDFLKRLSLSYTQLTPKDQKLCAYLKMNLTTKEIAPLLNISIRGVEISRYRLRKKLELEGDVNLNEFMMQF